MSASLTSADENDVLRESISHSFVGSLKVPLEALDFTDSKNTIRPYSEKNVQSLISQFVLQGCLRSNRENHIPCLFNQDALNSGLTEFDIRLEKDRQSVNLIPFLSLQSSVILPLRGRHRVAAAKKFLPDGEQWWVVDLFDLGNDDQPLRKRFW